MKKKNKDIIPLSDKILLVITLFITAMIPISSVYMKAVLSETNIELENLKINIEKQEKTNEALKMQINELASLDKIQQVANENGLSYNNDNVKVVEDDINEEEK